MSSTNGVFHVPNTRALAVPVSTSYETVTGTATATTTATIIETVQGATNMASTRTAASAASKSATAKILARVPPALLKEATEAYIAANKPSCNYWNSRIVVGLCVGALIGVGACAALAAKIRRDPPTPGLSSNVFKGFYNRATLWLRTDVGVRQQLRDAMDALEAKDEMLVKVTKSLVDGRTNIEFANKLRYLTNARENERDQMIIELAGEKDESRRARAEVEALQSIKQENLQLQDQLRQSKEGAEQLSEDVQDSKKEAQHALKRNTELDVPLKQSEEKRGKLSEDLEHTKARADTATNRTEELEMQLHQSKENANALVQKLQATQISVVNANKTIANLQEELQEKLDDALEATRERTEDEEKIEDLKKQLKAMTDRCERAEGALWKLTKAKKDAIANTKVTNAVVVFQADPLTNTSHGLHASPVLTPSPPAVERTPTISNHADAENESDTVEPKAGSGAIHAPIEFSPPKRQEAYRSRGVA